MLSDIPFLESVYQMLMLHKLKQLFFHPTAHIHRPHKTECHLSTQFCTSNLTLATVLSPSWHNLSRMWSKSRKVTKTPHPVRDMASAKMKEAKRHTWEKKRLCWSMDYFRERVLGKKHHESTKSTELQKGQSGGGVPSHWETVLFIGLIADKHAFALSSWWSLSFNPLPATWGSPLPPTQDLSPLLASVHQMSPEFRSESSLPLHSQWPHARSCSNIANTL